MYSPQTVARLDALRQLAQQRDLTTEEQREVVTLIRQDRVTAAGVSAASKAKAAPVDGVALLAKLTAALNLPGTGSK